MIKTIYFDVGNVLIFFSRPQMMAQLSSCTGLSINQLYHFLFEQKLLEKYETGKITTEQLYHSIQSLSPREFSLQELLDAASTIFTPNTELWPLVEALKKARIRLILLSNISECHFNRISSDYPIIQTFDHKILSYEVGATKPNPLIFQKALAHSRCSPSECFYTDDVPEFIAGARKVGLDGEIFTDVPSLRKILIVRGCKFLA
ncbi:MAG TPA: HAD family phosphatase [Chlamydiales bacterium]|nr:HAD family phosphatase [Chlamydiales bacterium]